MTDKKFLKTDANIKSYLCPDKCAADRKTLVFCKLYGQTLQPYMANGPNC